MPKGQSPSKRMEARRSLLNERVDRQSGIRLPTANYAEDDPFVKKLMGKAVNTLSDARAKQMQRQGGKQYQDDVKALNKIDTNRENEAQRSSRARVKKSPGDVPMFAEGGPVKAQLSGKGFKGTF
jgi:hypothetical protein